MDDIKPIETKQPLHKHELGRGMRWFLLAMGIIVVGMLGYLVWDQNRATNEEEVTVTPSETAGWETYTNSTYGFSFKYPTDWTATLNEANKHDTNDVASVAVIPNGYGKSVFNIDIRHDTLSGSLAFTQANMGPYDATTKTTTINNLVFTELDTTYSTTKDAKNGVTSNSHPLDTTYSVFFIEKSPYTFTIDSSESSSNKANNKYSTYLQILDTFTLTDPTAGWKTYTDSDHGFSFKYPSDWTLESRSADGEIVRIISPENKAKLSAGSITESYAYNLSVSYWSSINDEQARGGSWIGMRTYTSLSDYLSDTNTSKQKLSQTTVDNKTAYYINVGGYGNHLAIALENNGIYELDFKSTDPSTGISSVSGTEATILSTFKIN